MSRPFDPQIDHEYHPDNTVGIYLTQQQVKQYLDKVEKINSPDELEARSVIQKIEALHRDELTGKTKSINPEAYDKITSSFAKKYGYWPFHSKTSIAFYNLFSSKR